MRPPYLSLGQGRLAGRVLVERGRPQLWLTGAAVRTGVPFQATDFVWLRVEGTKRGPALLITSENMHVRPGRTCGRYKLRLKRPAHVARMSIQGTRVGFQFRALRSANELRATVPWEDPVKGTTWDGRHEWLELSAQRGCELRRRSDGAVMLRVGNVGLRSLCSGQVSTFHESVAVCRGGCCYEDVATGESGTLSEELFGEDGCQARWSPLGDRAIMCFHDPICQFLEMVEYTRRGRRWLPEPRTLPFPARLATELMERFECVADVFDGVTQAGELVVGGCVWQESRPDQVRRLDPQTK